MITTIAKDFDFVEEHDINLANFVEIKHNWMVVRGLHIPLHMFTCL
jgi:hypothetical protein